MIYKPWKKMTKEEKKACIKMKLLCGMGVALFGVLWTYFDSPSMALIVMGLLVFLYGLILMVSS